MRCKREAQSSGSSYSDGEAQVTDLPVAPGQGQNSMSVPRELHGAVEKEGLEGVRPQA